MNQELFEKLTTSKKYRLICPDTVGRILAECEGRYKKAKDLEKAVREKLHGITSAFMTDVEFKRALESEDLEALLSCHASTRERLPIAAMDGLYQRLFDRMQPASILDLACGLNPVYLHARYPDLAITGVDISGQCVEVMQKRGIDARLGDLLCTESIPAGRYGAALLFKILPLLERQRAGAAMDVMNAIDAQYLVVSFPTRTLGRRKVGMEENYSAWMEAHLPGNRTIADKFTTENELYYVLKEN